MSLSDRLAEGQPEDKPEFVARTEFDGAEGFIQTGPMTDDASHEDILREFGYDPDRVQIIGHPRISKWQQRIRIRGTNEYDTTWLTAYKFVIGARGFEVDLPALYAEVARGAPRQVKSSLTADATVVVAWADVQVGKVDHLGGLKDLLERLEEKRLQLADYLDRNGFDRIVVADVGDIIEGFDNFPAQHRNNSLSIMDQIDVAATELWKTLTLCASYAPVDMLSVPSNHCAWRRQGKSAGKPNDDWGIHINKRLERQAVELGMPITFHRPPEWDETLQFDVRGTRLGLAHGHQVSSPDQIKNWWAKMTHSGVLNADVLLTGHFHFASLRPTGRDYATGKCRWHIQCPTLDNGSSWWRNKHGEDGDPALAVFRITDDGFDMSSFALL